jgi:hypothetical protein
MSTTIHPRLVIWFEPHPSVGMLQFHSRHIRNRSATYPPFHFCWKSLTRDMIYLSNKVLFCRSNGWRTWKMNQLIPLGANMCKWVTNVTLNHDEQNQEEISSHRHTESSHDWHCDLLIVTEKSSPTVTYKHPAFRSLFCTATLEGASPRDFSVISCHLICCVYLRASILLGEIWTVWIAPADHKMSCCLVHNVCDVSTEAALKFPFKSRGGN